MLSEGDEREHPDWSGIDMSDPVWRLFPGTKVHVHSLASSYASLAHSPVEGEVLDRSRQASGKVDVMVSIASRDVVLDADPTVEADADAPENSTICFWLDLSNIEIVGEAPFDASMCRHAQGELQQFHQLHRTRASRAGWRIYRNT